MTRSERGNCYGNYLHAFKNLNKSRVSYIFLSIDDFRRDKNISKSVRVNWQTFRRLWIMDQYVFVMLVNISDIWSKLHQYQWWWCLESLACWQTDIFDWCFHSRDKGHFKSMFQFPWHFISKGIFFIYFVKMIKMPATVEKTVKMDSVAAMEAGGGGLDLQSVPGLSVLHAESCYVRDNGSIRTTSSSH